MVARADVLRWIRDSQAAVRTLGEQLAGEPLVTGYADELVGQLADRMVATDTSRVPILSKHDGTLVGLVARRDLLRVRANVVRQEREREALMRLPPLRGGRPEQVRSESYGGD